MRGVFDVREVEALGVDSDEEVEDRAVPRQLAQRRLTISIVIIEVISSSAAIILMR